MRISEKAQAVLIFSTIGISIAGALVGMLFYASTRSIKFPITVRERLPSSQIHIDEFSLTSLDHGEIKNQMQAKELEVSPKKLFLGIRLRPYNQVTFKNLKWKIYLDESPVADLFSFSSELLKQQYESKGIKGLWPRGSIDGLSMEIYKQKQLSMVIYARRVSFDLRKKSARLSNCSLIANSPREIISSRYVYWNNKEQVFKIPGNYIHQTKDGQKRGKAVVVDLDFNVSAM